MSAGAMAGDSGGTGGTAAPTAGAASGSGGAGGTDAAGTGASGTGGGAGGTDSAGTSVAGTNGGTGASGTSGGASGTGASTSDYEETKTAIGDYASAHPGANGDVTNKSPADLANDPEGQALRDLCGEDQLPVIPQLSWEYGGADHAWINYEMSALVYCVYTPVDPSSEHWEYEAAADHVTADVYVLFPDNNPCASETGADQIAACIGDQTNFEILVDTASINDGHDAGLELSESSTDLYLILPDGSKVHLFYGA
jgi:hypothetical protein